MELTKEIAKAIQFSTKAEAVAGAVLIGWPKKSVYKGEVMGFRTWSISDDHMNMPTRRAWHEAVNIRMESPAV